MNKGEPIPFGHLPGSFKKLVRQGNQNNTFEFKNHHNRKEYIYKELKTNNEDYYMDGKGKEMTPLEVADLSNKYFQLIKKHLKDEVVDTWYIVSKNRDGQATVVVVQPKIKGQVLLDIVKQGDGDDAVKMNNVVNSFEQKMQAVIEDPEFAKFNDDVQEYFKFAAYSEITLGNIMETQEGKYVLFDF